eukprot:363075_1
MSDATAMDISRDGSSAAGSLTAITRPNMAVAKLKSTSSKPKKRKKKSKFMEPFRDMSAHGEESEKPKTIAETYQRKTPLEHILLRPDTYIGSMEREEQNIFVFNQEKCRMVQEKISFVPGLSKIFDEILVNAADNKQRDPNMTQMKVDVDMDLGTISIFNDGACVPVAIHPKYKVFVPELIFGDLLTGSNFDDSERKTTGGRNGYGGKLANVFSTEFIVETADGKRKKHFKQVFCRNMSSRAKPVITPYDGPDWTRITFKPDLAKFDMEKLDVDIMKLFERRAHDIVGTTADPKIVWNGRDVPVTSFVDYCRLFLPDDAKIAKHRSPCWRWEIYMALSDGTPDQTSFVNSKTKSVTYGGTHVKFVTETHRLSEVPGASWYQIHGARLSISQHVYEFGSMDLCCWRILLNKSYRWSKKKKK